MLPTLVILPLVENSIQHGLEPRKQCGIIKISAYGEKDFITILVEDNGMGISDEIYARLFDEKESQGISLKNINQRLICLYNRELEIERITRGRTKVKIYISKKQLGETKNIK